MRNLLVLTLPLIFILSSYTTNADTITQKDGGVLKGKVISLDQEYKFRVEISGGSILVLTKEEIDNISFDRHPESVNLDEIYRTDGSVLKGFITEYVPNINFKIELLDKSIFVVQETVVQKIVFYNLPPMTSPLFRRIHIGFNLGYGYFFNDYSNILIDYSENPLLINRTPLVRSITLRYSLNQKLDFVLERRTLTSSPHV